MNKSGKNELLNQRLYVCTPYDLSFGKGAIRRIGEVAARFGKRAFVITGERVRQNRFVDESLVLLSRRNLEVSIDTSVNIEPTDSLISSLIEKIDEFSPQVIIAIGGGSVLDAGKAIGALLTSEHKLEEILSNDVVLNHTPLPVIAIPTTAGTGSEVSKGAILTWEEQAVKTGLRGDALFARSVLVDPSLTLSLPEEITKITGFDVFCHAVESYISRKASYLTAIQSEKAIEAVCEMLPKALDEPDDLEIRTYLSFHSMMMGQNLALSSTCLPHRLQYALGPLLSKPHALCLAPLYPRWFDMTYDKSKERFDNISKWMGRGLGLHAGLGKSGLLSMLEVFMDRIKLKVTLADIGVTPNLSKDITSRVRGSLGSDPWWEEGADLSTFLA